MVADDQRGASTSQCFDIVISYISLQINQDNTLQNQFASYIYDNGRIKVGSYFNFVFDKDTFLSTQQLSYTAYYRYQMLANEQQQEMFQNTNQVHLRNHLSCLSLSLSLTPHPTPPDHPHPPIVIGSVPGLCFAPAGISLSAYFT